MPEIAPGVSPAADPGPRLRDLLGAPGGPVVVAELVPWAGARDDPAGERMRRLADDLAGERRIAALSITDNAGGHARLSPEVLAAELVSHGRRVIVHVTCRDRNRSELLSLGWRLASAGIEDLLVLSGDYTSSGYLGVAKPVFDIDSVALLHLYDRLNKGIGGSVVARPIARDTRPRHRGARTGEGCGVSGADGLLPGCGRQPVQGGRARPGAAVPQAREQGSPRRPLAITQAGWDMRKLDELRRWVTDREVSVTLMASVMVLTRTTARIVNSGEVPGVVIPPALLETRRA